MHDASMNAEWCKVCAFSTFDQIFFHPCWGCPTNSQNDQNHVPPGEHSVMVSVSSAFSKLFVRWRHIRSRQFMQQLCKFKTANTVN